MLNTMVNFGIDIKIPSIPNYGHKLDYFLLLSLKLITNNI
jgi:hypothetical protein